MKYSIIFAIICLNACTNSNPTTKSGIRKEVKTILTGSDIDQHGCKASAGYQWSELKKDCIRSFELPLQLTNHDATFNAGIAFAIDSSKAEIFTKDGSFILPKENNYYTDKQWSLQITEDKWTLSKYQSSQIEYTEKNK